MKNKWCETCGLLSLLHLGLLFCHINIHTGPHYTAALHNEWSARVKTAPRSLWLAPTGLFSSTSPQRTPGKQEEGAASGARDNTHHPGPNKQPPSSRVSIRGPVVVASTHDVGRKKTDNTVVTPRNHWDLVVAWPGLLLSILDFFFLFYLYTWSRHFHFMEIWTSHLDIEVCLQGHTRLFTEYSVLLFFSAIFKIPWLCTTFFFPDNGTQW